MTDTPPPEDSNDDSGFARAVEASDRTSSSVADDDDIAADDPRLPIAVSLGVTVVVAATFWFALDPARGGGKTSFMILAAVYAALTAGTVYWLKRRHDLGLLRFRGGDITVGGMVAALLYGLAFAVHVGVTARPPREGWIYRIYQLLGGPFADDRVVVSIALASIGIMEELVWRGLVFGMLEGAFGRARALVASSVLFGLAHLPTVYLLRDEIAGLNPLLPLAALGCGIVWCYLRIRTDRLLPSLISHGLFTWAVVQFPLWNP